jgi:hypothetical protein
MSVARSTPMRVSESVDTEATTSISGAVIVAA